MLGRAAPIISMTPRSIAEAIESGDVYTGQSVGGPAQGTVSHRKFIDVLQVRARGPLPDSEFWTRYESDLNSLIHDNRPEARIANQGRLARRCRSQ